jgi:hypothetical protein
MEGARTAEVVRVEEGLVNSVYRVTSAGGHSLCVRICAGGDFGGRNILVRCDQGSWRVAGLLDWEGACTSGTGTVAAANARICCSCRHARLVNWNVLDDVLGQR